MKFLKFNIKPIYLILGLFIIVLIVSALGSKTKEGFSLVDVSDLSTLLNSYNPLINYYTLRTKNIDDLNKFLTSVKNTNFNTATFITNVNSFFTLFFKVIIQAFMKNLDVNKDNKVVVTKSTGGFLRDNSGEEKFQTSDPNILAAIDYGTSISSANLDAALKLINDQIETLSFIEQKSINSIFLDFFKNNIYIIFSVLIDKTNKFSVDSYLNKAMYNQTYLTTSSSSSDYSSIIPDPIFNSQGYDKNGYDAKGYDKNGYDAKGYDKNGYDKNRYNKNGYDAKGYNKNDYDSKGYNKNGYDAKGYDAKGYDAKGYDKNGYDSKGYDAKGYDVKGYDTNGYRRSISASASSSYSASLPYSITQTSIPTGSFAPYSASSPLAPSVSSPLAPSISSLLAPSVSSPLARSVSSASNSTTGGLTSSNIPQGDSDLYMLKSKMLPPNCPAGGCSTTAASAPNNYRPAEVPPCPPCERCPEPAFDCKKVPNYNSTKQNKYLPRPVLTSFSQFGM
jgi:hypothetical protein